MFIENLINKKNNNEFLSYNELKEIVDSYMTNIITDEEMTLLLRAICKRGMNEKEIFNLTKIMLDSGDQLDLTSVSGIKVDKHSTGGVGDKTTLIIAPLVAACGVIVPKLSGRGLGHTGGTIDKLESIPGFKVDLTEEEFIKQLNEIGVAITTTSLNLVPADKKIYALRNKTNTFASIPLIASSIMSKKLATGADKIVLDVKVGSGAFMKTIEEAIELAKTMVNIGKSFNKQTIAILTNMSYPLGYNIGNALEVLEAIEILKGSGNTSLREICLVIAAEMVSAGKNISIEEAKELVIANLDNGKAYEKFKELITYQHGNVEDIKTSDNIIEIKSNKEGYINNIDALQMGELAMALGAGRKEKDEIIDLGVGIVITKSIGDYIKKDEVIAKLYVGSKKVNIENIIKHFTIEPIKLDLKPLIYEIIK